MRPAPAPDTVPPPRSPPEDERPDDAGADPQLRLLRAIGLTVGEKGYAATTIADIVGRAHVSKRTFYEHFPDKLACFLVAYQRGNEQLVRRMTAAGRTAQGPWPDRLRAAIRAYLGVLVDVPAATRTFTLEIQAAGPAAIARRREMHQRAADALVALVEDLRRDEPALRPLRPVMATAVIGAMTELIITAVADGRTDALRDLDEPICALIAAVLTASE